MGEVDGVDGSAGLLPEAVAALVRAWWEPRVCGGAADDRERALLDWCEAVVRLTDGYLARVAAGSSVNAGGNAGGNVLLKCSVCDSQFLSAADRDRHYVRCASETCANCGRPLDDPGAPGSPCGVCGAAGDDGDRAVGVRDRLEYLRAELRAERISYGELLELQGLADHIEPGDAELLEAAGVPEESAVGGGDDA